MMMQLLKVPISVDLLGNPAGLMKRLGSGMRSFLYEPVVAMSGGPSNLGVGIFRGTSALARQTAIGLSDAVAKVSGQVSKVTGLMAGASSSAAALVRARERHFDEDYDPDDLSDGSGEVEVEHILVEDDAEGWTFDDGGGGGAGAAAAGSTAAGGAATRAGSVTDVGPYPLFADATLTHRRRVLEAMLHSVEPRGIEDALPLALRGYNPGLFVEDASLVARASLSALLRLVARPATGFFGFARAFSATLRTDRRRDVQRVRPARCIPTSRVVVPYSLHAALGQLLMVNALVPRNRAQLVAYEEGKVQPPCWGERYVMHCNPVTLVSDTLLLTSHRIMVLDEMGAIRWSGLLRDVRYAVASTNEHGDFLLTIASAGTCRQLNFGPGTQHIGRSFYNALAFLLLTQRVTHAAG
uniref:Intermembrane lipid transfer protein VPS13-like C-terminal domain-containing protein n=1 Tax=Sexangularia sp. CB-2014 TaxID=1486929 RepID=A0A7S1VCB5_9EUKA